MEGYHVMMTHPQLSRSMPGLYKGRYSNDTGHGAVQEIDRCAAENRCGSSASWFGLVQAAITRKLRERGESVPDLNAVAVSHPERRRLSVLPLFSF